MRRIASRVAYLFVVLWGVSFLVFMLLNLLPGDPAEIIAAAGNDPSPEAIQSIREGLGLDRPLLWRYWDWITGVLQGDLGQSYRTGQSVADALASRLPVTLELVLLTEILALVVAVPLAIVAAYRRNGAMDRAFTAVTFGLQAIPSFVLALVLIYVFAVTLGWFPALGYVRISEDLTENLKSLAIPVMALAAGLIPIYFRILRNEMIRTLQEDFILMARAEGLSPRTILFRYAMPSSMPTLVTVVGLNIGALIGGTLIVEGISGLPGIGTLLFTAISNRDYILVQGLVLFVAFAYVFCNFLVDISYSLMDPRVK